MQCNSIEGIVEVAPLFIFDRNKVFLNLRMRSADNGVDFYEDAYIKSIELLGMTDCHWIGHTFFQ